MARPRKNRLKEYAGLLVEEFQIRLVEELAHALREMRVAHTREVAELRAELRAIRRRLDRVSQSRGVSKSVGRWVPGGPGRPPKDAAERIAAFSERSRRRRS